MLKIRLMRIGAKKRPFYRVVAVDERAKRTGGYLELLGTYDPMTTPHEIKLKQDRIDILVKQGAQLSDGFLRIIGKAPQRPPRKPKKEKKVEEPAAPTPEAAPTEESAPAAEEAAPAEPRPKDDQPMAETETPTEPTPEVESAQPEVTPTEETPAEEPTPAEKSDESAPENKGVEEGTSESVQNKK